MLWPPCTYFSIVFAATFSSSRSPLLQKLRDLAPTLSCSSPSNHGFKWHYNACDSQIYVSSIYIYYLSSEQAYPVIYFTSVLDSLTKLSKLMCPNGVFNYPQVCLTRKSFPSQKTKLSSTQIHMSGTWRLSLMLLSSSPTSNLSANSVNSIRKT